MQNQKIETKIVSGDNTAISARIAKSLNMNGDVFSKEKNPNFDFSKMSENQFENTSVFSEVLPIDKYNIVEFAKQNHIVAVTGDGVNDIPPIKSADVGISVKESVDALKGAADIVILKEGISVIKDAITESRKIFSRLYTYTIYRISESFRVILTILILGAFYREFPLLPIHLIILALLNDIPIISLAFNRVEELTKPAKTNSYEKFFLGSIFGVVGILNSLIFFFLLKNIFYIDINTIQTMFFLKLSVSGHMLIYIAHTKKRWFRFLPSKIVIAATTITQIVATLFAFYGFLMTKISPELIIFVWVWAFIWMQITEITKSAERAFKKRVPSFARSIS